MGVLIAALSAAALTLPLVATARPGNGAKHRLDRLEGESADLRTEIEALHDELAALRAQGPMRVFDGEGNDIGAFAGRDRVTSVTGSLRLFREEFLHVFFEDLGVTATYTPDGQLATLTTFFFFESTTCEGPAFSEVGAGLAGSVRFENQVGVAVTAKVGQPVVPGSVLGPTDRLGGGGLSQCLTTLPPGVQRTLLPVEIFREGEIDIALELPRFLVVAPAE